MSLSSSDITTKMEEYIKYIEDSGAIYWNADIVPTKENWGLTTQKCVGDNPCDNAPANDKCTSNYLNGHQCFAFARFIAYLLTGTALPSVDNYEANSNVGGGWTKITNLTGYNFKPGDIVETTDPHTAIVLSSNGTTVRFLELWTNVVNGCKPGYGYFYNGSEARASVDYLRKTTAQGGTVKHVIKCPPIEEGTPAPKPDKYIVNTRFYQNHSANDGTVHTGTAYAYTLDEKFGSFPTVPTREGYSFAGWFTDRTGGIPVTTDSVVSWDKNNLYAQWIEDVETVTVSFYDDTLDNEGKYIEQRTYIVGERYDAEYEDYTKTFPSLNERTGYRFDTWYTASGGNVEYWSNVRNDITKLYAHWNANTYDVTLNKNDGTNVSATESFVFGGTYGEKLGALEDRYGYKFKEWNTKADGEGVPYDENSKIEAKNLDLYAIWEAKKMKVTYNYGYEVNGTVKTGEGTLNYGDTYADAAGTNVPNMTDLDHPTGGYEFKGWFFGDDTPYADVQCTTELTVLPEHPNTVYAKWEAVTK